MKDKIWGLNPVLEALRAHPHKIKEILILKKHLSGRTNQILTLAQKYKIPVRFVEKRSLPPFYQEIASQGIVAHIKPLEYSSLEDLFHKWQSSSYPPLIVILDQITDPQNMGSIIRSSEAAGAHGIIIPKKRSVSITGVVIKASAGAAFYLPVAKVPNLVQAIKWLKQKGLWVLGLEGKAEKSIYEIELTVPLALVIGSEGKGLRKLIREHCDFLASIPMKGKVDSLNAAVAGAIALFEVLRQRILSI